MIALVLALAMQLVAEPAAASSAAAPFRLRWDAPPECPGETQVRAAIERHLGAPLSSPLGDGLRVEAIANQDERARWNVDLEMASADGRSERTIGDAPDCAAASETAALIIAIAIDPGVALRDPAEVVPPPVEPAKVEPQPVAPARVESPPSTVTPAVAPPVTPPRTPLRLRVALGARADATFGALPRVGFGGTGFVDLLLGSRGRIGVGASISGAPPLAVGDAEVRMRRWTVEVRGCPVFAVLPWLELVPCVGVQAGQTRASSEGLADAVIQRTPWLAPTAQFATVFVPRPRLGVWLGVHGLVPVYRREYQVEVEGGSRTVHTTAPFAGGVLVGIEARLP